MILIISDVGGSVNDIIDWIISKKIVVHRLNPLYDKTILINEIYLGNRYSDIEITYKDNTVTRLSDYTGVWIWHSTLKFSNAEPILRGNEGDDVIQRLKYNLEKHHRVLINYLGVHLYLNKRNVIGNYAVQSVNKLEVLHRAKNIGLSIPCSYIVTNKNQLIELIQKGDCITKPYYEAEFINYQNAIYQSYTSIVSNTDLVKNDDILFPTLIQKKIDKQFELRIFYLKGEFYSMAIFSQQSEKTSVDFRNYNYENPNRTVPYKLPNLIETKLRILFKSLNLNCGSADMIFSKEGDYVFLEINPVGQFGMVSLPCNYYLEEILMKILTNEKFK